MSEADTSVMKPLTDADRSAYAELAKHAAKSLHQQRVEYFMKLASQEVPAEATMASDKVRKLRAKLVFEEAMELINGLGVEITFHMSGDGVDLSINDPTAPKDKPDLRVRSHEFEVVADGDFEEIADGCCDVSVVTIGTLSAFGLSDEPLLKLTDENNLDKFRPGHSIREDGKLIKPPNHPKPDFKQAIKNQSLWDSQGAGQAVK